MAEQSGEKTEEPTQKKIDDSRKKGQVWKSRDMTGVAVFLVGLGAIKAFWPFIESELRGVFAFTFEKIAHPVDLERAMLQALLLGVTTVVMLTLPVAVGGAVIGGLVDFLQVGPLFSMQVVQPKLEKLNPIQGMKNLVSKKQLVEAIKSMLKMSIAAYVVYGVVRDALPLVVGTIRSDTAMTMEVLAELVFRITVRIGILFLLFSIFDVWFQRHSYYKDLRMTKDEVKREYKESEGDPHHKAARKQLHMEILEGQQMEAVKDADVVVTNPDHVAVALRYERGKDAAPRVVLQGVDHRAEAIKRVAREHQVAILRNVPLAHALLALQEGDEVPEGLYEAVAEVLMFVYGLQRAAVPGGRV